MTNNVNVDMGQYYDYRKLIHKLYDNEVNTGDLYGKILEIRDKNRCIVSISIDTKLHLIEVEFDDNTELNKKEKIIDKITDRIGYYISDNIDKIDIPLENKSKFELFITSYNKPYCDIIIVGNNLRINL